MWTNGKINIEVVCVFLLIKETKRNRNETKQFLELVITKTRNETI
jgi:hypothetical protein